VNDVSDDVTSIAANSERERLAVILIRVLLFNGSYNNCSTNRAKGAVIIIKNKKVIIIIIIIIISIIIVVFVF